MRKIELLAPAGNYECFVGALRAGADAVYLGGNRFGARAYADNFTDEQVCEAIRYAHFYGKKIYLTVNTLVKETEFPQLTGYLEPFSQAGLDGVIIQDLGVLRHVKKQFPDLELHASTQMTVTGVYGARLLWEYGVSRVVPARELSLDEIRRIRQEVPIEIETFVHGAMCYCYSGQCLFSSLLGGRSGNRGRCAQPCRLPYQVSGENQEREQYPLSLKDLCAIGLLPELIEAGIDSLKIEGRMKKPEYAAGVTAIYRKYLDRCYDSPKDDFRVAEPDLRRLNSLYIRSGVYDGYYHTRNGRKMITLTHPGYNGNEETLLHELREQFLGNGNGLLPDYRVAASALLQKGNPSLLKLTLLPESSASLPRDNALTITAEGPEPEIARRQPLSEEDVRKQLGRFGNTLFHLEDIRMSLDPDIFLPVKTLNELRRTAVGLLEEAVTAANGRDRQDHGGKSRERRSGERIERAAAEFSGLEKEPKQSEQPQLTLPGTSPALHLTVSALPQLQTVLDGLADVIYLPPELWNDMEKELLRRGGAPDRLPEFGLALPYIIREADREYLERTARLISDKNVKRVLARNPEALQWLKEIGYDGQITADSGVYLWNREAALFLQEYCSAATLPYELNGQEIAVLAAAAGNRLALSQVVYGRLPMMVTANCIRKTMGHCGGGPQLSIIDRYRKSFPVSVNCQHCYNMIYNSLPLSLHGQLDKLCRTPGIAALRLDFTVEDGPQTGQILRYFSGRLHHPDAPAPVPPYEEYTCGHYKRGVE